MTTVIYGDETGALLATVETTDAIKDQLFDAYLAKTRWPLNSRWYAIRGYGSALRARDPERFG
jgi:hypothetical protein